MKCVFHGTPILTTTGNDLRHFGIDLLVTSSTGSI